MAGGAGAALSLGGMYDPQPSRSQATQGSIIHVKPCWKHISGGEPLSIVDYIDFSMTRNVQAIAGRVNHIYNECLKGRSFSPSILMPHDAFIQEADGLMPIHYRKHIWECACPTLDRKKHPQRRENYENFVIKKVLEMIESGNKPFAIKLALFCSGGLLGEEILLMRLFQKLRDERLIGKITLFLIDLKYRNAIINVPSTMFQYAVQQPRGHARLAPTADDTLGRHHGLGQFLEEISECLPQGVQLEGTAFGDDASYKLAMQEGDKYKHELLIGADMDQGEEYVEPMRAMAGSYAITLEKTGPSSAVIKKTNPNGSVESCSADNAS